MTFKIEGCQKFIVNQEGYEGLRKMVKNHLQRQRRGCISPRRSGQYGKVFFGVSETRKHAFYHG